MQDTFYIASDGLLRSHVERAAACGRVMPPLRIIALDSLSQRDDCCRSHLFHQIEGLYIAKFVLFESLRLWSVVTKCFTKVKTRYRPSYFPSSHLA
jgi:phenylalanyl-tRNA synthetase alpha subunit